MFNVFKMKPEFGQDMITSQTRVFYPETAPKSSVNYFETFDENGKRIVPCNIATVTVFYNEEGYTMEKTMKCLSLQHGVSEYGHDLLLVGDGLQRMTSSMAKYLSKVFSPVLLPISVEDWPAWANTCVINTGPNKHYWNHGRICMVLKKFNKGKWNSHEWHMKSFANNSHFCFLTDVGCQYNTDLLTKFIHHLQVHDNCVAVTGRRTAQTEHQQTDPWSNSTDTYVESMLRALQYHLFESENNSRIENFIGCVPILHGHCTFYRWSTVLASAYVDLYFRLAYQSPAQVGFIMAQLRLAEDSVQGTYLLTHIADAETHIVEDSFIYFDAELSWEKLAKQRRRWNNSNFAAAKYLLLGSDNQPRTILGSSMSPFRKIIMLICMLRWIFTLVSYKFFIAIFAITFFKCNMALSSIFLPKEGATILCATMLGLYFLVYITFVWVHLKRFGSKDSSFNSSVWTVACFTNGINMLAVLLLIPLYLTIDLPSDTIVIVKAVSFVSLAATFLPWIRTCYMDRKRIFTILFHIPSLVNIILMAPMVGGFMQAYHLARAMDLSWGNRPGMDMQLPQEDTDTSGKKRLCSFDECSQSVNSDDFNDLCEDHLWMRRNITVWMIINFLIVVLNILITVAILLYDSDLLLLVLCSVSANIHTSSILIVIVADVLGMLWKTMTTLFLTCKSIFTCEKKTTAEYVLVEHRVNLDPTWPTFDT